MAVHSGQSALYMVSRDTKELVKLDLAGVTTLATVPTGNEPWDVLIDEKRERIYVSNFAGADVWVYHAETLDVITRIGVGGNPSVMEFLPDLDTVAVVVRGLNGVAIIQNLELRQIVGTTGAGAYGLAADPVENHLIVVNRDAGNARVLVREFEEWKPSGASIGFGHRAVPFEATYNPQNRKLYVVYMLPSGEWFVDVLRKDSAERLVKLASVEVESGGTPRSDDVGGTGLVVSPKSGRVFNANTFANSISVLDGTRDQVVETIPTGEDPFTLTVNPATGEVFVALRRINRLGRFLDEFGP